MRTLIIDNHDSFTFNLYQYMAEINSELPVVIKNNEMLDLRVTEFDNIIISPGPGRPDNTGDFGVCADLILRHNVPILGVCLGHQGIGHLFGGHILHAPSPVHGRTSLIHHWGTGVLQGLPSPFTAVRYHSLIVDIAEATDLRATAHTDDGVLMGLEHRTLPIWGVQFHPESICSEYGMDLLRNFRDLSLPHVRTRCPRVSVLATRLSVPVQPQNVRLHTRRLGFLADAEAAFCALYGTSRTAFWLDSSLVKRGLSRFSFMGDTSGPLGRSLVYDSSRCTIRLLEGGNERIIQQSIFEFLESETQLRPNPDETLPFTFQGGWVGYLGYELKAESGGDAPYRSPYPDAQFLYANRFLAFDHEANDTWLVELDEGAGSEEWLDATQAQLVHLQKPDPVRLIPPNTPIELRCRVGREDYLEAIRASLREINEGESYEICLTNQITVELTVDNLSLYRVLRRTNPAPFAAYLQLGDLAVISASPERFLRVDENGFVEAKPIKGTAPRSATEEEDARNAMELQVDEKSRAENLMIVDLLRNDIGTVCKVGTVSVPKLMEIESYATVHQLVSTITGQLAPGISAVECVRRSFPGGSMTGAPKIRTLRTLDRLEGVARGIYSGAIGYFGLGGTADFNIVIRTIISENGRLTLGVGGAIVAMSDPEAEYDEILLKAKAQIRAILMSTVGRVDERDYHLIDEYEFGACQNASQPVTASLAVVAGQE